MTIRKRRLLVICEGYEEKPYMDKLLSFPCFNKDYYCFSECINAKSNSRLFAQYQNKYQSSYYDAIFVFCDYDKGFNAIKDIQNKFANELFGGNRKLVEKLFILANPVTLQVVLSHFGSPNLNHVSKVKNSNEIKRLTGIDNYSAKQDQINEIISKVKYSNYETMKMNIKKISTNLNDLPSTNLLQFLSNLESNDSKWLDDLINEINN